MNNIKPRVLIVDDDDMIRDSLLEFLEYEGFEVSQAEDAEEGLSTLDTADFEYAIIDYRLPNMNGLEMAKEIKKKDSKVIIIMISGDSHVKSRTKEVTNLFLEKPFDFLDLYDLMTHADEF